MAFEIEHKYLVKNDSYKSQATKSFSLLQGYLCKEPERTVRVRIKDGEGYITVKGKNTGCIREEFEYKVPYDDAIMMIRMCIHPIIEKTRYIVPIGKHVWEVDEFSGSHTGLITAEIELSSEDERYEIPDFVGENVTGNPKFYNSNL